MAVTTKIIVQQILNIDDTKATASKFPRYTVTLGNSISSITASELVTSIEAAAKSAAAAKDSEIAAKTSELNAKNSEQEAAISAGASEASATQSATSATQSAASATKSAKSAAAAKVSETNAKASETKAKTSETNAKTSETNAKSSETKAKASETNAKTSETKAAESAAAAKISETNAKTSETKAAESAASAADSKGFRDEAEAFATQAAASAAAAKVSETNAKASETNAKSSETKAKASETNAASSATSASQSVTTIQGLKSDVEKLKSDTQTIKNSAVTETTALKDQAAASATNAANSATEAGKQATNAANSAKTAKTEADRAKTEADRSEAAISNTPELQPLPDVWIPFNDSLDMITGFSPSYKKIVIGDDEITMPGDKIVKFKRASTATYINKSGELTMAEIDEPRFEKDGLLIEGQRSNAFADSNNPSSWNKAGQLSISNAMDDFNFTYGVVSVVAETSSTGRATFISTGYPRALPAKAGESLTISCRVKKLAGNGVLTIYPRIAYVNDDGSSNTLVSNAYINVETGEVLGTPAGGNATKVYTNIEPNGWLFISITYTTTEEKTFYGRIEVGAHQRDIQIGDQWHITTPQFEVGSFASSFIISGSATTTRASDMVTIPLKNNIYNLPWSCLVEVNKNWDIAPNAAPRIFDSGGHKAGTAFIHGFRGGTAVDTGSPYIDIDGGTGGKRVNKYVKTTDRKIICGFRCSSIGDVVAVCNGVISTPGNTTWKEIVSTAILRIGGQTTAGERHLFGHIRNLRIWRKALTDRQLKESV